MDRGVGGQAAPAALDDQPPSLRALQDLTVGELASALRGPGLLLDVGACCVRMRSDSPVLPRQLQAAYRHFPHATDGWADLHVDLMRPAGLRRWWRPQVQFRCDGSMPFEPFAADSPLPLAEWGVNWLIGQRLHDLLLLHAGALERDGRVLLLPAVPGSGKSTLTAALSLRGWRLLSDEFGAFDPARGVFLSLLKPIALKNQSIDVIRDFEPCVPMGPSFPGTRKGTVAHVAPDARAVAHRHQPARPGVVLLPQWRQGSPTQITMVPPDRLFSALAYNAFNYTTLGEVGFSAVVGLARTCPGHALVYSDLADALAAIDQLWSQHSDGAAP